MIQKKKEQKEQSAKAHKNPFFSLYTPGMS
jgi:hypothetical protein